MNSTASSTPPSLEEVTKYVHEHETDLRIAASRTLSTLGVAVLDSTPFGSEGYIETRTDNLGNLPENICESGSGSWISNLEFGRGQDWELTFALNTVYSDLGDEVAYIVTLPLQQPGIKSIHRQPDNEA